MYWAECVVVCDAARFQSIADQANQAAYVESCVNSGNVVGLDGGCYKPFETGDRCGNDGVRGLDPSICVERQAVGTACGNGGVIGLNGIYCAEPPPDWSNNPPTEGPCVINPYDASCGGGNACPWNGCSDLGGDDPCVINPADVECGGAGTVTTPVGASAGLSPGVQVESKCDEWWCGVARGLDAALGTWDECLSRLVCALPTVTVAVIGFTANALACVPENAVIVIGAAARAAQTVLFGALVDWTKSMTLGDGPEAAACNGTVGGLSNGIFDGVVDLSSRAATSFLSGFAFSRLLEDAIDAC
jgi:hypothetical protein